METTIQLRSGDVLVRDITPMPPPAPHGRGWVHISGGVLHSTDYYPVKQARALILAQGVERVRRGNVQVWPRHHVAHA
ncbi:MAG: hypothetical protein OEW11_04395 [Nitrospirota bacterium]|nr:hypothetical protein [Nitrospirota bacterium]